MGLEGLQKYIESKLGHCLETNVDLKSVRHEDQEDNKASSKRPLIFVVHAESCKKHVYPMSTDWVCGGQWNEMLYNLEKFVRCFRQSNIELVVFFDGSNSSSRLHEWKQRHKNQRETVKQLMSKVVSNRATPPRRLAVTPACFNSALRLALKSCNVIVCSSIDEVHRDITNYYRSQRCAGIIAQNCYYLLQRVSNCFLPDHLKVARYQARSSRIDFERAMQDLGLSLESLPIFAALVGSPVLPAGYLATFHWSFLGPDHPLKSDELKGNVSFHTALPPNEIVFKGVADFLKDKDLADLDALALEVFREAGYDLTEAASKLKESVEYYSALLEKRDYPPYTDPEACVNRDGYPIHTLGNAAQESPPNPANPKRMENSYQKRWQQFQKVQSSSQSEVKSTKKNEEDGDSKDDVNSSNETHGNVSDEKEKVEENDEAEKEESKSSFEAECAENENDNEKAADNEQKSPEENLEEKEVSEEVNEEKPVMNGDVDENLSKEEETSLEDSYEDPYDDMKPILKTISTEVLGIARRRHQSGEMAPEILQILSKGEILIDTAIDEEHATMRPPIPLLYRPIRQLIYGILYDQKIYEERKDKGEFEEEDFADASYRHVKEFCVYKGNSLETPDLIEPVSMPWDIPPVKNLWLGRQAQDNTMRMKAFLTCMKSDTQNMSNVGMVPQRMLLLCCVLRYLIQQEGGKSILSRHDIDAFLAQALSPHLTTEANSMNLANLKLNQIDVRAMQLASIFMSGIEVALIANDACGSPVPWEFCCPWLFFDGKLFHSKWLQSSLNVATLELCDGKPKIAEKLERLRWCITEGLSDQFKVMGLKPVALTSESPFGPPPTLMSTTPYGVNNFRTPVANYHGKGLKGRGASSKRPVLASGGTLEVAGVPVAHWSGNKSGISYSKNNPDVVVGGRNSVDLPSDARGLRRGMGRSKLPNRGRGLLPTPLFSPWPVDYDGMRGVQPSFGRNQGPQMPVVPRNGRPPWRSLYRPVSGTRRQDFMNQQGKGRERGPAHAMRKPQPDMWIGKARGRGLRIDDDFMMNNDRRGDFSYGRGWGHP